MAVEQIQCEVVTSPHGLTMDNRKGETPSGNVEPCVRMCVGGSARWATDTVGPQAGPHVSRL